MQSPSRKLLFLLGAIMVMAVTFACSDANATSGTPIGGSGIYTEREKDISEQVLTDAATVSASMESAVSALGDAAVLPPESGVIVNLHRDAESLSSDAQSAVFRLSVLVPPDRCKEFHRHRSEAVRLYGQMAFEYSLASGTVGTGAEERLDLQYVSRGDAYRTDAQAEVDQAEALRAQCQS